MGSIGNVSASVLLKEAKLVFWDFDGVIKESLDIKTQAFMKLFEAYGKDVVEQVRLHHQANGGMSRYKKFPLYLRMAGIEPGENLVNKLCDDFSELVMENVINSEWVPGAENYVRLNPNRQTFVMVSGTPHEELEMIVDKLDLKRNFRSIFGAPVSKGDVIDMILKELFMEPSSALMIGDATADFDAALMNKVPFLLRKHQTNISVMADYKGISINDFTEI